MVRGGRCVSGQETEGQVAPEADPGEEENEPDDKPGGTAAIGLLLGEKIRRLAQG